MTLLLQLKEVSQVKDLLKDQVVEETQEANQVAATQGERESGGAGPKLAAKGKFKRLFFNTLSS